MSSLRNAVKRITHKERPQPAGHGAGFLERKKDYKHRAVDYHRKEDRLNAMRQKAAFRNPDEFYFGMKHTQISEGKHRKTAEAAERLKLQAQVGQDTLRIMKDQDLSYVRMQRQKDDKKVQKLRSSLHFVEENTTTTTERKHTVFVADQQAARNFDAAQHFNTVPELVGRTFNRPRKQALVKAAMESIMADDAPPTKEELRLQAREERKQAKKVAKARDSAYKELREREKRMGAMRRAEGHLLTEKLLAAKGRKRKIKEAQNGEPAQYKWRRKRLR